MKRKASKITQKELHEKLNVLLDDEFGASKLLNALGKDIKVKFDCENFDMGWFSEAYTVGPIGLMGYQSWPEFDFWGMVSGGDWEFPVYFIVYWDGRKLRGYVPTEGNPWNTQTKQAYGNDPGADLANAKRRWPEIYKEAEWVEEDDFKFEPKEIEKDIRERLESSPSVVPSRPGLYRLHWTEGGSSLAAVGKLNDGTLWFAPIKWVSKCEKGIACTKWEMVARAEPLDIEDEL